MYIGWPGRVHDARVFANLRLYQRGQSGNLPDWKEEIDEKDVPLVVLEDLAYPLLPWLMKTYPNNGHLSREELLEGIESQESEYSAGTMAS